jgi:hypothetical protein
VAARTRSATTRHLDCAARVLDTPASATGRALATRATRSTPLRLQLGGPWLVEPGGPLADRRWQPVAGPELAQAERAVLAREQAGVAVLVEDVVAAEARDVVLEEAEAVGMNGPHEHRPEAIPEGGPLHLGDALDDALFQLRSGALREGEGNDGGRLGALRDEGAVDSMHQKGEALRDGLLAQARAWGLPVSYTGPAVMPYLTFDGDKDYELARVFAAQALRGGAYLHPRHNWFVSAAMTGDDLALALDATDQAFAAVRKHLGQ